MTQHTLHAFTDDALGTDDATALAERLQHGDCLLYTSPSPRD